MLLPGLLTAAYKYWQSFWNQIKPPQAFSWQTLIGLSVLAWFLSLLTSPLTQSILAFLGWCFLIGGVSWALAHTQVDILGWKFHLGPWVTGALISVLVFVSGQDTVPPTAFISWPIISAAIAALPKFLGPGLIFQRPTPPIRQNLVLMVLLNLLLSCWFQFYFLMQDWLQDFPSVLADDFSQSVFVVNLGSQSVDNSRGVLILEMAETELQRQLGSLSWPEIERWLLERDQNIEALERDVMARIPVAAENQFWELRAEVPPGLPEYTVLLQAIWDGPSSRPAGHYLQKSCLVEQANSSELGPNTGANTGATGQANGARIICSSVSTLIDAEPLLVQDAQPGQAQFLNSQ